MRGAIRVGAGCTLIGLSLACGAVAAQSGFPFKLPQIPGLSPQSDSPPAAPIPGGDKGLLPVKPNPDAANELTPDELCRRVEENTDVWKKLADYGGVEAQLRMRRLLESDFQHSDLTPADREMLRYIAYTTIWVPSWLESSLGKLYVALSSESGGTDDAINRRDQASMQRIDEQLQAFRAHIPDFPGNVQLTLDSKRPTGASAQPGGLITLSSDFLNRMDENIALKRLVLAHELSHLYKRHTIKELQYQLITSSGGFEPGRKLLRRFDPNANTGVFAMGRDAYVLATAANELLTFVRANQLTFQATQELEADACSVEWMRRIDGDPMELWQAFADIELADSAEQGSYLGTHPSNEARRTNIEKAIRIKGSR